MKKIPDIPFLAYELLTSLFIKNFKLEEGGEWFTLLNDLIMYVLVKVKYT